MIPGMSNPLSAELHEKIRIKAYLLWEKAGCPGGDGSNFWSEAEAVILRMAKLNEAKKAKASLKAPAAKPEAKTAADPALSGEAKPEKKKKPKKEKPEKSDKKKSEKKKDKK